MKASIDPKSSLLSRNNQIAATSQSMMEKLEKTISQKKAQQRNSGIQSQKVFSS